MNSLHITVVQILMSNDKENSYSVHLIRILVYLKTTTKTTTTTITTTTTKTEIVMKSFRPKVMIF